MVESLAMGLQYRNAISNHAQFMANGLSMESAVLLVVKDLGQEPAKILNMAVTHASEVPIKLATRCHASLM